MKSHSTPIKKAKDKNRPTPPNIGKDGEQSESSYITDGIINYKAMFGKVGRFF